MWTLARLIAVGAALMLSAANPACAQAKYKWDLSDMFNETALAAQGDMLFAKLVKEKTNGQIDITVHLNGSLGFKGSDHFDSVQDGALVLASTSLGALVGFDPIFHLGTMPFLAGTPEHAKMLWDVSLPYFQDAMKKHGQIILGGFTFPSTGFWAKRPITKKEDLQNWKVRVYDQIGQAILRKAGAAAVNMIWNDVVPALSTGTIDGVLTGPDAGIAARFNDYLSHFTQVNYVIPFGAIHMNKKTFDELTPAHQKALVDAGRESTEWVFKTLGPRLEENYAEMRKRGMTVIVDPPKPFVEYLHQMAVDAQREWTQKNGKTGEAIMTEYKKRAGLN
jgi:TRAP-type transport system periplasmic protein